MMKLKDNKLTAEKLVVGSYYYVHWLPTWTGQNPPSYKQYKGFSKGYHWFSSGGRTHPIRAEEVPKRVTVSL